MRLVQTSVATAPIHRVVVYYQTQFHDKKYISPTPLISLATHLVVGAFHINEEESNRFALNDDPPSTAIYNQMWADIERMQGSGVKVMGMLGGAGGATFGNLEADFDKYYSPLKACIQELDGLDLDVEEEMGIDYIKKLIQNLKVDFGRDFIITLAPVASAMMNGANLSGFSYNELENACGNDIDWYNAQFYSGFGSMENANDYANIVNTFPLDPSRLVAITLTNSDNGSGWVEIDTVKSTMRELLQMYGHSFGGVAGWEYYNSQPDPKEPWSWAEQMKVAMVNL